jgi:hypothetical protein
LAIKLQEGNMPILTKMTEEQFKELPEVMQDAYEKKDDGVYYLTGVDGMVPKKKVDEFRETSRKTQTELEKAMEQLKQFEGVDLEHIKAIQEKAKAMEEKQLIEAGDIDKIVEERVKPIVSQVNNEKSDLQQALDTVNRQLGILKIDNRASELAVAAGVEKSALPDVITRANRTFKIVEGKTKALDADGKPVYGADGITPMSLDNTWMESLKKDAPHLFRPPQGTGAEPGAGSRPGSGQDPSSMSAVQKIGEGLNTE